MSEPLDRKTATTDVPNLIAAAGDDAVRAYREFLDDPARSQATRKLYATRARRFFLWAQSRGLTLATIDAPALAAYAAEIAALHSRHEAQIYLSPVRGVLGQLARSGILATDPCPTGQPNGRLPLAGDAEPSRAMPQTPEEWQDAVDAAHVALLIDSLIQYGLIRPTDGDFTVNADRCYEILDRGRALGYTPSNDDDAAVPAIAELMKEPSR